MTGNSSDPLFGRIALIGIGLIGSSLARVIRRNGLAEHIAVAARTQQTLDKAMDLGLADSVTLDARQAARISTKPVTDVRERDPVSGAAPYVTRKSDRPQGDTQDDPAAVAKHLGEDRNQVLQLMHDDPSRVQRAGGSDLNCREHQNHPAHARARGLSTAYPRAGEARKRLEPDCAV